MKKLDLVYCANGVLGSEEPNKAGERMCREDKSSGVEEDCVFTHACQTGKGVKGPR